MSVFEMTSMIAMSTAGTVLMAGLILAGVGLCFVIVLTIADARLKVEVDPTIQAVEEALPGVNCGGCGLAGCSAYAKAVVSDHGLIGRCGPGGEETSQKIAEILGIEAAGGAPERAVVHCAAHTDDMLGGGRYQGPASCAEAQMVAGTIGCPYGCLGMGDCVRACDFDAIHVVDGLATVDYDRCVGCGACVKACPRQLISLERMEQDPMLIIACSSLDKVKEVRSYCQVGCVGCGLCSKLAPTVFQVKQNLAVIDYQQYLPRCNDETVQKAVDKCPRKAMVYVGRNVPSDAEAAGDEQAAPASAES